MPLTVGFVSLFFISTLIFKYFTINHSVGRIVLQKKKTTKTTKTNKQKPTFARCTTHFRVSMRFSKLLWAEDKRSGFPQSRNR